MKPYDFWNDEPKPEGERKWRACLYSASANCSGRVFGFKAERECQHCRNARLATERGRQESMVKKESP